MVNQFEELLVQRGLYDRVPIDQESENDWLKMLRGDTRISCFCPECGEKRVFILDPPRLHKFDRDGDFIKLSDYLVRRKQEYNVRNGIMENEENSKWFWRQESDADLTRVFTLSFRCAMNDDHHIDFFIKTGKDYAEKAGQKPSVADLSLGEIDRLKKVVDDETRKELRRAIGLNAQGIGVGSYVYLRRIFEKIIEKTKKDVLEKGIFKEEEFHNKRIDEQISLLKDELPDTIVNNKVFYRIVSKGIHELSEDECINYFPVLNNAILLILKEWQRKKEEREVKASLSDELNRISSEI